MTNLLTRSNTCLVSGIVDIYHPVSIRLDLGELIFINSWLYKVKTSDSRCQLSEGSEYLHSRRKVDQHWLSTTPVKTHRDADESRVQPLS